MIFKGIHDQSSCIIILSFSGVRYRYDNRVNIEISIRFSIIFNCVSGVIAWAADIYKYASNTIYTPKLLHITNNKPRKLVDKLLKWLDCTEPTFVSSVIVQSHTKMLLIYRNILQYLSKFSIISKSTNVV